MNGAYIPSKRKKRKKRKNITKIKMVEECNKCKKKLKNNNKHHFFCQECWEERQIEKGNTALIPGIK